MGNDLNQQTLMVDEAGVGDDDSMKNRYLTFRVGNENYGIPISCVTEIVSMQKVTEVPDMPDFVKGVINLRGQVIPVIDVRLRFKLSTRDYDDRTCAVVVNLDTMIVGLIVDAVDEVLHIDENSISPAPTVLEDGACNYIKGMGRVENGVKILLDIHKLLYDEQLATLTESF